MVRATVEARFWAKVQLAPNGCWLWTAGKTQGGYGCFKVDGERVYAYHWSYEHWIGPWPDGLEADHTCQTPACVNPWHIDPVTHLENVRRGRKAQQTHCLRGHPLSGDNLYVRSNGTRWCRACRVLRDQWRKAKAS